MRFDKKKLAYLLGFLTHVPNKQRILKFTKKIVKTWWRQLCVFSFIATSLPVSSAGNFSKLTNRDPLHPSVVKQSWIHSFLSSYCKYDLRIRVTTIGWYKIRAFYTPIWPYLSANMVRILSLTINTSGFSFADGPQNDHRIKHPQHLKFRSVTCPFVWKKWHPVYRIQLGLLIWSVWVCKWTLKKEWYGGYSWVFYTLFHSYLKRTNNKKHLREQSWTRSHTSLNQNHSEFPGPSPFFIYIQYIMCM